MRPGHCSSCDGHPPDDAAPAGLDDIDARRFTRWFLMQPRVKQADWMRHVAPSLSDLTGWEPDSAATRPAEDADIVFEAGTVMRRNGQGVEPLPGPVKVKDGVGHWATRPAEDARAWGDLARPDQCVVSADGRSCTAHDGSFGGAWPNAARCSVVGAGLE